MRICEALLRAWRRLTARQFVEPECGVQMRTDRWYLLSDSGSAYTSTGFCSVADAVAFTQREDFVALYGAAHACVPTYSGSAGWSAMDACNVLSGRDLRHFWRKQDPECFNIAQQRPAR